MTATDTDLSGVPLEPTDSESQEGTVDQSGDQSWASLVGGVVLVALGATWLLSLLDVIDLRAAFVLPAMLALVGLALTVGSIRGSSHPGLIVLGSFLTIATCFAAVAPAESLRGGLGERVHVVTDAADLEARYELGLGDLDIDLSDLTLDSRRRLNIALGAGDLNLTLPRDLPVLVTVETGAGEIMLFDEKVEGVALDRTYRSPQYDDADARLRINIEVGAGSIEVKR